jgi:hypothetical protein
MPSICDCRVREALAKAKPWDRVSVWFPVPAWELAPAWLPVSRARPVPALLVR